MRNFFSIVQMLIVIQRFGVVYHGISHKELVFLGKHINLWGPVIWSRVPVYIRIANTSRGARQLRWANFLTSAGRLTLTSGTIFLRIKALALLTGTTLGVASVM